MKIHIVQKGDTLNKIAKKYGTTLDELKQANAQLSNPELIMPGMKIKVPSGAVSVKKTNGAGSASPKEYVKEVQQTIPAQPKQLGIESEEQPEVVVSPVTEQPAMQQPVQGGAMGQKEVQVTQKEMPMPQKEVQVTQKEMPIAAEKEEVVPPAPVVPITKTAKPAPAKKDTTKFSVNILPQPPKPPAKGFNVANEFKAGPVKGTTKINMSPVENKANIPSKGNVNMTAPAADKTNVMAPAAAKEQTSNFNFVSPVIDQKADFNAVLPAADKTNAFQFEAPPVNYANVMPAAEKGNAGGSPAIDFMNGNMFVSPAADKPNANIAMPALDMPNMFVSPAADKPNANMAMPAFDMPNTNTIPAFDMPNMNTMPAFDMPNMNTMPAFDMPNMNTMPALDTPNANMSMPVSNMPGMNMSPVNAGNANMFVSPTANNAQPVSSYASPTAYAPNYPYTAEPSSYGGAPYAEMPYGGAPYGGAPYGGAPYGGAPYGGAPYGGAPYGGMPYGGAPYGGMPYGEMPYGGVPYGGAPYGGMPYGEMPYGGAPYGEMSYGGAPYMGTPYMQQSYAPGAYIPESSSLYMQNQIPMPHAAPAYDNMAPRNGMEEDCGCSDTPVPYAPQPGGPYGMPYYPQAPYYQSMPYIPYAPQPGTTYYRDETNEMFGTPNVDDDDQ